MSITITSKKDNLTIGRWFWPNVGYELTFSQRMLLSLSQEDLSSLAAALEDGRLSSDVPLYSVVSGTATSTQPQSVSTASVDDSVGREVRAVIDDNDKVQLVALGFGPIEMTADASSLTVVDNLVSGGSSLPLSAEQGKVLAQTKYTKPSIGIPTSDLSPVVQITLGKAESAYQKPGGGIPTSDLSSDVQASLAKANTAVQTIPVQSVAGKTGAVSLTKGDVGLSNVDNTPDATKPVSAAQQAAINQAKIDAIAGAPVQSVAGKTGSITLTKADVGLSDVENTSDSNKPVSTAQATAIAQAKAEAIAAAPVQSVAGKTGTITLAKADVGLSNVDNTSDANKPVSTAQSTALALKLDVSSKASDSDAQGLSDDTKYMTSAKVLKQVQKLGYVTPEMFSSLDAATPGNNWYSIKAAVDFARTNGIPKVRGMKGPYTMNIPGSTGADKIASLICANDVMVDFTGSTVYYNYGRAPLFYWYRSYSAGTGLRGRFVFTGPAIGNFNSTNDIQPNALALALGVPGATGNENALMLNRSGLWVVAFGLSSDYLDIDVDIESQTPCTLTDVSGASCGGIGLGGHYDMGSESTTWLSSWRNAVGNRVVVRAADCSFPVQFTGQTGLYCYATSRRRPGIVVSDQIGAGHVVYCSRIQVQKNTNVNVYNTLCDVTSIDLDDGAQRNANNGQTAAPKGVMSSKWTVLSKHYSGAVGSFGHDCSGNSFDIHWTYEGTDNLGVYAIASSAEEFKNNKVRAFLYSPNTPAIATFSGSNNSTSGMGAGDDNDIEVYIACNFNIPAGSGVQSGSPVVCLSGSRNKVRATLRPTQARDGASSSRCKSVQIAPGEDNDVDVKFVGPNVHGDFLDTQRSSGNCNVVRIAVDPLGGVTTAHVNGRDGRGLLALDLTSVSGTPAVGDSVTGTSSGAAALVVEVVGTAQVFCAQNATTGQKRFLKGEALTFVGSGATATVGAPWGNTSYLSPVLHSRAVGTDAVSTAGSLIFKLPSPGVYDVEVELTNNAMTARNFYGFRVIWGPSDSGAANMQVVGTPVSIGPAYLSGSPTFSVSNKGVVSVQYTKAASQTGRWAYGWTLKNSMLYY